MDYQHAFLLVTGFTFGILFEHTYSLIREYCSNGKCANFKRK